MEAFLENAKTYLLTYAPSVLVALTMVVAGHWIAKLLARALRRVAARAAVDPILVKFLGSLTYVALFALVLISALGRLGVNTTSFVAIVGAAGLAVGLAFQGTLGNFAAGVMVIFFRPFKAGDFIEAGGQSGTVEEVQVFATVLKTPDNKRIIIPNSAITGGNIVNYSANDTRRIDLTFGIGYDDEIRLAKSTLEEIVAAHPLVLDDPAPLVALAELGDSSVNFYVRPWVKTADYWAVRFALTETVKETFDSRGISIPFPQRDVHLYQTGVAA